MDRLFPFGFPGPTALYLVLYVVTLIIHVLFMNYVLAGSAVLAVAGLWRWQTHGLTRPSPTRELLRDWLPFFLSAAITAGIAPLLFIQILYRHAYYTANLLLFHRWMAILPVLILGFYLLYLLKSRAIAAWRPWQRALTGALAMLCFWFTAYSWTENHMLSLHPALWASFYAGGHTFYWNPLMVPRLSIWVFGAFPTMSLLLAWQLRYKTREHAGQEAAGQLPNKPEAFGSGVRLPGSPFAAEHIAPATRQLALIALGGMAIAGAGALWYYSLCDELTQAALTGPLAAAWLIAALVGGLIQSAGWLWALKTGRLSAGWLAAQTVGLIVTLLGMTVGREAIRMTALPIASLYEEHAEAAKVGGLPVFLAFFVINAGLIVWAIRLARRKSKDGGGAKREGAA
ncbi:MAG: hypothetical protein ACREJ2_07805 [Planctomycetota bacterium]